MDHAGRIARLRAGLSDSGIDAFLITNLTNVRYLTGFSGTNGQVLVTNDGQVFFSDPRYEARAKDLVQGAEIVIYPGKFTDVLAGHLDGIDRLGIEASTMSIASRDEYAEKLELELVPVKDAVEELRRVKEPDEVAAVRTAAAMAEEAFSWVLDRLVPGALERDIALDLEVYMRRGGADAVSFDPIVGSGPLSAHIHHTPSDRAFEKGDLILLDFGARFQGYCSDLTRTVVIGPATDEQRDRYDVVLAAQRAGIGAVRAGTPGMEIDAAARKVIADAGYGELFPHSLGHGVGLDIHETPSLKTSEVLLAAGEIVTVEPGIYVPGEGGIRIEDCVVATPDGAEVLGSARKDVLLEL